MGDIVRLADIIEPTIFQQYVIEQTVKTNLLITSGIVATSPVFSAAAKSGGRTVRMPYWTELSGADEVLSDSSALTTQKLGTAEDIATLHFRGAAWSANDLVTAVAGSDPMMAIANQTVTWWNAQFQAVVNATLKGIFATTLASTHVKNISIEDGVNATDANKFNATDFLAATFLLGDRHSSLQAIVCHSTILHRMLALDLIDFSKDSQGAMTIPTYMGRRVIVDDDVLKVAGGTSGYKYYTFLFGPGALAFGEGTPDNPVEVDRDVLAGDDILVHRRHFILHPRGVKWGGSPASSSPTNVELAVGASWTKVWQDKNIKMVAFVTNG